MTAAEPDARDAEIARLEDALAEARTVAAVLRRDVAVNLAEAALDRWRRCREALSPQARAAVRFAALADELRWIDAAAGGRARLRGRFSERTRLVLTLARLRCVPGRTREGIETWEPVEGA